MEKLINGDLVTTTPDTITVIFINMQIEHCETSNIRGTLVGIKLLITQM